MGFSCSITPRSPADTSYTVDPPTSAHSHPLLEPAPAGGPHSYVFTSLNVTMGELTYVPQRTRLP